MSSPGAGFEYPPQTVSWLKRDALLFAASIGCTDDELHFLYELDPNFSVFPTYSIVLPFKGDTQEAVDFYAAQKAIKIPGVPEFDARRVVDGQRLIQFLKPLPTTSAGKKFEVRTKVLGVYDKGRPGTVVELQVELVETGTGDVYSRMIGSSFYVAQGNWGGPKGPATVNYPPPQGKKPDAVFEDQTTKETALLYRLNGDYNPLHAHPEPGKKMGFGGSIIHGLYQYNSACHGLLKHFGGSDPNNIKEFQARFASPVRPGDKIITQAWRTGEIKGDFEEIRFVTSVEGGKVCLSNGRALIKVIAKIAAMPVQVQVQVGDRLSYDGALCTVRYIGKSKAPTAASFVRPTRTAETPQSFVAALKEKYTSEISAASAQIKFSGKIAEEVGFEKIRRRQADLAELKFAIVDGTRIAYDYADGDERIGDLCPKIVEADFSRNLFTRIGTVVQICSELPALRSVRLNGNRFQNILQDKILHDAHNIFSNVKDLAVEETLMSWEEVCHVATRFPALATLSADMNQLPSLPPTPFLTLSFTLTSLNLEWNEFTSFADLASLSELKSLRNLHLKGNNISALSANTVDAPPVFSESVQYLDLSYNQVTTWSFIDDLPASCPGLVSLRFAHNPIYDNPDPEFSQHSKVITEEAYMITVGRMAKLKSLNFGSISANNRQDAEMFYLARIGKHLAAVPEAEEAQVIKQHKRYTELCDLYGTPVVNRKKEINPAFLEARLVTVQFAFQPEEGEIVYRTTKIPMSFDIYRVKGIAGKLFEKYPLGLRLIWETGEFDPVAGFDDEVDDNSEDEATPEATSAAATDTDGLADNASLVGRKGGKWIKREVELQDGPRQLGFCVDGLQANVRVEVR
ncbi:HotDog domain-containing protein [Pseudomassariella vexata]|uniref:HotDog domain-containing protein n=1 Tax=Pseudomassariella vexata TaxID=1141098 RepID=A0A1Y2DSR1_9PEZI|nr:HotDog domain-containing protein [Pseudomassariella vexata]ORY62176.1 HotDog domain-containing protein [Pseudomassariella vexata]